MASVYAEAGVAEYWIVLGGERQVEVYRKPEQGGYRETRRLEVNDILTCASLPAVSIPVASLFP
jgi:Uma2 family endonuclease